MISLRRVPASDSRLRDLHRITLTDDKMPKWTDAWWWIAFDNEKDNATAAFCGLQPSVQWCDAMYLVRAGTHPDYRGLGLQRRCIYVRERFARSLGMNWLVTSTLENPASANNLIKCGFTMYEPSAPWGVKNTLYWKKRIDGSPQ